MSITYHFSNRIIVLFIFLQLTAMVNASYAQLYIQSTNESLSAVDMMTMQHSISLVALIDATITFGAQNPNTSTK